MASGEGIYGAQIHLLEDVPYWGAEEGFGVFGKYRIIYIHFIR